MGYFNIFAYMLLGSIHAHRGEYVAAQHAYTDALAVDPATARIFISWASGWQVVPDRDNVLFKQLNALAADPTNPDLLLQVANLYLELGYWSDAIAQYHAYLNVVDTPPTGLSDFTAWLEQNLE
jgi:tetratricopeptide (TPR) repeat protein